MALTFREWILVAEARWAALSGESQISEVTLNFSGRSQGSQELERSSSSRKPLSFSG